MMAVRTNLTSAALPDNLHDVRSTIEAAVPHGRTDNGGAADKGAWSDLPAHAQQRWADLADEYKAITDKHPNARSPNNSRHMATLGTGNHFIELCLDEADSLWVMLHSGSRGCGNRIGSYFIELAKREMERWFIHLPDKALAYFPEGSACFEDYWNAVGWAARLRPVMERAQGKQKFREVVRLPHLEAQRLQQIRAQFRVEVLREPESLPDIRERYAKDTDCDDGQRSMCPVSAYWTD